MSGFNEERPKIPRIEDAVKKEDLSIRPYMGQDVIFYKDVPLWSTVAPLEVLDIFLYNPTEIREEDGDDFEPYSLFCVDQFGDIYTWGMWQTEKEARAWLENPTLKP